MRRLTEIKISTGKILLEWEGTPITPARDYLVNGDPGEPYEGGFERFISGTAMLKDLNNNLVFVHILPLFEEEELINKMLPFVSQEDREQFGL